MNDITIGVENIPNILNIVKEVYEERKDIKICSLYKDKEDIIGVYMNPLDSVLSLFEKPNQTVKINTYDDNFVYLFSLEELLHLIYTTGSFQMVNVLLHPSELDIDIDNEFYEIKNFVQENIPFLLGSFRLIDFIERNQDSFDYEKIKFIYFAIDEFKKLYPIDFEFNIDDIENDSDVKIKNQLNLLCQFLKEQNFQKISSTNMDFLNQLFVDFQKKI